MARPNYTLNSRTGHTYASADMMAPSTEKILTCSISPAEEKYLSERSLREMAVEWNEAHKI